MNILTALKEAENLTPNEKRIADYILKNTLDFVSTQTNEIPGKLYVSLPTLYRLINKLGFKGINEFKLELKAALHYKSELPIENMNFPIAKHASINEILLRLKDVYVCTIDDTLELANSATLYQVGELMEKSSVINVYTFAGNIHFAENFRFQMQEIGITVNVPREDYMQHLTASNSDASHLSIVISFGGRSRASETLCRILKDNHSPIVLIASTQNKKLTRYAKHIIYMSAYEDHYRKISSFSTRITLLYILDSLYTVFFSRHYKENVAKKLHAYENMAAH
ncbi:MAG TPA: MurR/RpiR family transcriptional regulator, partial [Lachnoclostridium sp.]|nr:MurR/RpiR family transcriptional regulator [Lachnoclostridium sp.]